MKRIEDQHPARRDLAKRALLWITHGQRSLSIAEMQQAVAIELGESDLDPDSTVDCDDIISACTGLVTRGEDSSGNEFLRLVHYTTQEYLERTTAKYFQKSEEYLASSCLTYLLFDVFSGALCTHLPEEYRLCHSLTRVGIEANGVICFGCKKCWNAEQHKQKREEPGGPWKAAAYREDPCSYFRTKQYPFYEYAVWHWGDHTEKCDDEAIRILTKTFLDDTRRVSGVFGHFLHNRPFYYGSERLRLEDSNPGSAMQLAAYLGMAKVVSKRLEDGFEPDVKDWSGLTPLRWAVDRGHEDVVDLLMTRKDVNPNVRDRYGKTPLIVAVQCQRIAIVQRLLANEYIEINAKDDWGSSALHYAVSGPLYSLLYVLQDALRIMKLLFACADIEVNLKDNKSRTALHIAVDRGNTEAMQLLLAHRDIQVNERDKRGRTALHIAANRGNTEAMQLLLAHHDIQVNERDNWGRTALHIAAERGNTEAMQLLLARDELEANATNDRRESALFGAVRNPPHTVAERFLARGDVDVNIRDSQDYTPLYHAIRSRQRDAPDVVQLLLTHKDLKISVEDGEGERLLSLAEDEQDKANERRKPNANAIINLLCSYFQHRSSNTTSANLKQRIPERLAQMTEEEEAEEEDDHNDVNHYDNAAHGTDNVQVIKEQMLDLAVGESP